jgi:hypothetical protein
MRCKRNKIKSGGREDSSKGGNEKTVQTQIKEYEREEEEKKKKRCM